MNEIAPERDSRPGPTGSALDPSRERIVEMGMAAVEWVAGYLESIRDLPVTPQISSAQLRSLLAEPLPAEGREFGRLLEVFATVIAPGTRHHGHRRFFGYVSAPGTAVASVADLLASALNASLPAWRSAPAPVELERLTIDWIKEALGCAPGADGAAAHARPLRIYASTGAHHSTHKAAALLGIGRGNVRQVAVDDQRCAAAS